LIVKAIDPYSFGSMDLTFISGDFLKDCLPRDKQYLYNYFKTDIQICFVRYIHTFGNHTYFAEHTGCPCTRRNLQILTAKLHGIEDAHRKAKSRMDFDLLEKIEKGKFKLGG
jgi:hypothetical protein